MLMYGVHVIFTELCNLGEHIKVPENDVIQPEKWGGSSTPELSKHWQPFSQDRGADAEPVGYQINAIATQFDTPLEVAKKSLNTRYLEK